MSKKIYSAVVSLAGQLDKSVLTAFGKTNACVQKLDERIEKLNERKKKLNEFTRVSKAFEKTRDKAIAAQKALRRVRDELEDTAKQGGSTEKLARQLKKLGYNANATTQAFKKQKDRLAELKKEMGNLAKLDPSRQISIANKTLGKLKTRREQDLALSNSSRLAGLFGAVTGGLSMGPLGGVASSAAATMVGRRYGVALGAAAGLGVGGLAAGSALAIGAMAQVLGEATEQARRFELRLVQLGNIEGYSARKMTQVRDSLTGVSKSLGISQFQTLEMLDTMVAANVATETAIGSLETAGRVVKAYGADAAETAATVQALNAQLNITPREMERAFDVLAVAGKDGLFELRDMAAYLPEVASKTKAFGLSGISGVASLASMLQITRKNTGDSASAANNLVNMLDKIADPETARKAAKLGINIEKIVRNAQRTGKNPIEEIIKSLDKVTKGGDPFLLGKIFGDRQARDAVRSLLQNWKEYETIRDKSLNASGVVKADLDKVQKTNQAAIDRMNTAWQRFSLSLGRLFDPVGAGLADISARILNEVARWEERLLNAKKNQLDFGRNWGPTDVMLGGPGVMPPIPLVPKSTKPKSAPAKPSQVTTHNNIKISLMVPPGGDPKAIAAAVKKQVQLALSQANGRKVKHDGLVPQ